eukprot:gene9504-10320_t
MSIFSMFTTPKKAAETSSFVENESFHTARNGSYTGLPSLANRPFDPSQCTVYPLPDYILQWRSTKKRPQFAVVIENVLSAKECRQWLQQTENKGYEAALVNVGGGRQKLITDVRKSSRCIIDDEERCAELWQRIRSFIPDDLLIQDHGVRATGLNERLRFLRYDPGDYFAPHLDGSFTYPSDHPTKARQTSFITCQLYLNDGFEGGATRFFTDWGESRGYDVVPKAGSVLLFEHAMNHEGSLLVRGRKYAMRTDVMYEKIPTEEEGDNVAKEK